MRYHQRDRNWSKAGGRQRCMEWTDTPWCVCMCVCVHTDKTLEEACINLALANRKPSFLLWISFMFSLYERECSYVLLHWYVLCMLQSNSTHLITFKWIWEKVNCSVKLGNGLFDVWALLTWHFYYSKRRKERRDEEEEDKHGEGRAHLWKWSVHGFHMHTDPPENFLKVMSSLFTLTHLWETGCIIRLLTWCWWCFCHIYMYKMMALETVTNRVVVVVWWYGVTCIMKPSNQTLQQVWVDQKVK